MNILITGANGQLGNEMRIVYKNTSCDIQPCYSSEYESVVTRPSYSVLDKRIIKDTFGVNIPYGWILLQFVFSN